MKKLVKIGGQFSGVGAFDQALNRLNINYQNVYQAEWDKFARTTYLHNYEEPIYYVKDVYDTPTKEITEKYGSLDIAMFSPPCQSFSLAGKREGKNSDKGILFFNSHEFIQVNKPRYFIFENVKGLLSDDNGKTFSEWVNMLGGKSVNGNAVMFSHNEAIPYHIYWQVLNAKNYGVPQNRERVFIIGIRDDRDNNFSFPKEEFLAKRLKDVLESEVDEKYFLSDKMLGYLNNRNENSIFGKGKLKFRDENSVASTLTKSSSSLDISDNILKVGYINQDTQASQVFSEKGTSPSICAGTHGYALGYVETEIGTWRTHKDGQGFRKTEDNNCPTIPARAREDGSGQSVIKIKSATLKGYETATENDSINFSVPNSETRRGRVGKQVAQTLDTQCNQGVLQRSIIRRLTPRECFRLMDFPDSFVDKIINNRNNLYFQFIYSNFDINNKETIWNVKSKVVKDTQIQKNLETYVLCTTKECQKMEHILTLKQKKEKTIESKESQHYVNFAIMPLVGLEQKECATNIIKWIDYMEIHYTEITKKTNQIVVDISDIITEKDCIEPLWKITLEENLSEEKLCIILILLKQIIISKTYTYAKTPANTQKYISSIINYEKKSGILNLSFLKMEYTSQLVSDSMLYKQAGNSIVVAVLEKIIRKFNL